jgi:predicted nucleic acid-binding protein
MTVLVDATAWSLALRRDRARLNDDELRVAAAVEQLVMSDEAAIIGPIRQEVLSGVRQPDAFEALRDRLADFPDLPTFQRDFERAAQMHNECAARGIRGSHYDFLLCSVAERIGAPILSTDRDFERYVRVLPVQTFEH